MTIVYIALHSIVCKCILCFQKYSLKNCAYTDKRAKRASAPEMCIFMSQKETFSVWSFARPTAIIVYIVNTILIA